MQHQPGPGPEHDGAQDVPLAEVATASTRLAPASVRAPEQEDEDDDYIGDVDSDDEDYIIRLNETGDKDDKKKKKCCSCCTCSCFFCWKMPMIHLPLTLVIFINMALCGVFLGLYFSKDTTRWANVLVWQWIVAVWVSVDSAVVLRVFIGVLLAILEFGFSSTKLFYYINSLGWPMSALLWGIGLLITQEIGLSESEAEVKRWLSIIFIMVIVFSAAAIVHIMLVKLILGFSHKKKFWQDVSESLFREKVIAKIISGQKKYAKRKSSKTGVSEEDTAAQSARSNLSRIKSLKSVLSSHSNNAQMLVGVDNQLEKLFKQHKQYERLNRPTKKMRNVMGEPKILFLAKVNGNRVFDQLDQDKKNFVTKEDLNGFFKDGDKLDEAYEILQTPPQIKDKLTRREVVKAVNITYKQRDKLVKNLRDRRGVAGVLSKIIALFLLVICGIIFITIIGLDVSAFLSPVTTAVLAISFIFGGMASNAFKSFVFLFSVNAFDVGDRIAINGQTMIVSKISLLSTRTFAPDGRHFILNNAQISDGIIINYTRTTGYAVSYTIVVAATTPAEKLLKLKNYITTWIHRRRNVWNEDFMFEVSDLDKVNATVSIDFWCMLIGINWGTVGAYYRAKNEFFLFIKAKLEKLGIDYHGAPIAVGLKGEVKSIL